MRLPLLAAAAIGAFGLSACATDVMFGGAYGPPRGYADVEYNVFYDGFYGPFAGGYWGPGGYFYYSDRATGRFHRDHGRHFRREGGPGFNPIQGHAPPPADGRHGRPGHQPGVGRPGGPPAPDHPPPRLRH